MTWLAVGLQLRRRGGRGRVSGTGTLFAVGSAAVAALAAASMYLLRPHWVQAPAPAEAPPVPIIVAGVVFNVPPAAIRIPMQRRAGPQERIDLAYQWPQLTPPAPPTSGTAGLVPLLFVTIERSQDALAPAERLKSVYPRYLDQPPRPDGGGLVVAPFRDGSPYQGEDVIYDPDRPDRFLVRCSRARSEFTWATCLYGRQVGGAALTFRFPRQWLADWRCIKDGIDRLITRWRPTGR
jgi:hypothetical protein